MQACVRAFSRPPGLMGPTSGDDYQSTGTGLYLLGPMNGKVFLRNKAGEVISAIWEDAVHETTSFRFSVARSADASLVAAILIAAGSRLTPAKRAASTSPTSSSSLEPEPENKSKSPSLDSGSDSPESQLESNGSQDDARSGSPGRSPLTVA
jgi:hypothetical protein